MKQEIPIALVNQIKEGNVILFLGAGATFGATHPKNEKPPLGEKLANLIAKKFLSKSYHNNGNLQYVSELAISQYDLFTVQKFVAEIFEKFSPGEHHFIITKYPWHSLYTTNYDFVVEKAYQNCEKSIQNLSVFIKNGQKVETKTKSPNTVHYNKLHGCLSEIADKDLPLILTPDQYVNHKKNRSRLFDRLKESSYDFPLLFIGFSFADWDIRYTLQELNALSEARPRSYMVGPNITEEEDSLWEAKKITSIKLTFSDFMKQLEKSLPEKKITQKLAPKKLNIPIESKFKTSSLSPSEGLINFLENDVEFVYAGIPSKSSDPKNFYKGYFENWDPIIRNLDVEREINDSILSEVFLAEEDERITSQELYVIKGNAGSGKTVLLKRIAWDASVVFERICLWNKSSVKVEFDFIEELYSLTRERIFLFYDSAHERVSEIDELLVKSRKEKVPITIVCGERKNSWNVHCNGLNIHVSSVYDLGYLKDGEISKLIDLLEANDSLGHLENKTNEEQVAALSEKAGRELLVALHEATLGRPFADIVLDEYKSIPNDIAKSLYLTICIFHRVGAYARAGVISRLHDISFAYFKEKLFEPLESIVHYKRNYKINDYEFLSRHQHIAELVVQNVLVDSDARLTEYLRILDKLDIDYSSDRQVFIALTNAKSLLDTFKDPVLIRSIYRAAKDNTFDNSKLLQQEAIFEMHAEGGSIDKASLLLNEAHDIDESDVLILHSKAELEVRKAERVTQPLLKSKLLNSAKEICDKIISNRKIRDTSHAFHTILKIFLIQLKDLMEDGQTELVERKINDFEKTLNKGMQRYPNHSFFLDAESNFNMLLNDSPKALESLKKAYDSNKKSAYLGIRLSNYHLQNNKVESALEVLEGTLTYNSNNKDLNYKYAKLLERKEPENYSGLKHYYRKSFAKGDKRFDAQFWYARCLYLNGEEKEAKEYFESLKNAPVFYKKKREPNGFITGNGQDLIYDGLIKKLEKSFGFVSSTTTSKQYFFHKIQAEEEYKIGQKVKMKIGFNYQGPVAVIL